MEEREREERNESPRFCNMSRFVVYLLVLNLHELFHINSLVTFYLLFSWIKSWGKTANISKKTYV
jgi:hypothetical protein